MPLPGLRRHVEADAPRRAVETANRREPLGAQHGRRRTCPAASSSGEPIGFWVCTSHSTTFPSAAAVTSVRPSGVNCADVIRARVRLERPADRLPGLRSRTAARGRRTGRRTAARRRARTPPSARSLPVSSRLTSRPVPTSRISVPRSVSAAAASSRPSGLKAIESARAPAAERGRACAVRTSQTRSGPPLRSGSPDVVLGGGEQLAVGREGERVGVDRSPLELAGRGQRARVPERDAAPDSGHGQQPPVGAEGDRPRRAVAARAGRARRRSVAVSSRSTVPSLCVSASVRPSGLTAIPLGVNVDGEAAADGEAAVEPAGRPRGPRGSRAVSDRAVISVRPSRRDVEPVDRTAVPGEALRRSFRRCDVPDEHLPVGRPWSRACASRA